MDESLKQFLGSKHSTYEIDPKGGRFERMAQRKAFPIGWKEDRGITDLIDLYQESQVNLEKDDKGNYYSGEAVLKVREGIIKLLVEQRTGKKIATDEKITWDHVKDLSWNDVFSAKNMSRINGETFG